LQRRTSGVGKALALGVTIAAKIQNQAPHGIRRAAAVAVEFLPIAIPGYRLILDEGVDQIGNGAFGIW